MNIKTFLTTTIFIILSVTNIFAEPDSMYIYISGSRDTIISIAINEIDSIIYYDAKNEDPNNVDFNNMTEGIKYLNAVYDSDSNGYTALKIGEQIWMGENLRTSKTNDGTPIPLVTDNETWEATSTSAYCFSDFNYGDKNSYGALYNWYTVQTNKICPEGWHVPSNTEWEILEEYIAQKYEGGEGKVADHLKKENLWQSCGSDISPDNATKFSAIPGNIRFANGKDDSQANSFWWSATVYDYNNAYFIEANYCSSTLSKRNKDKNCGLNVRCIKN